MSNPDVGQELTHLRQGLTDVLRQLQLLEVRLQSIEKVDKLVLIEIRGLLTKMDRLLAPGRLKRSI